MGVVDPSGSVIVLHIYCGMIKVVPLLLDSTEPLTAFNIRCLYAQYSKPTKTGRDKYILYMIICILPFSRHNF